MSDRPAYEISVEELMGQLRSKIELLAAPASVQKEWLRAKHFPEDELGQQFLDAVPLWFGRLKEEGVLRPSAERALLSLEQRLNELLVPEMRGMWIDEGLTDESVEWQGVRELARQALEDLDDRPPKSR